MATLTKVQAAARAADRPWHEGDTITEVTRTRQGWSISANGSGFFISREQLGKAKPPQVGDAVATYVYNGWNVRGIDLRGEPLFYKTQAELDAEHEEWRANHKIKQRQQFEKERKKLDRQFASLPDVFQRRVSWFRAWKADFRWENEAYELASCIDAVKIAEAMRTPKGVQRFAKMSNKKQKETIPDLAYDHHSGNSFGFAVRLAYLYLENPLLVIAEHGALTPLVGCDEYGCAHPRPADVLAAIAETDGDGQ